MRNRAFTVIELLLAVVITAVISAVAVVSYNTVVTGSDERVCSDEATAVLKMVYLDSVTTNSPVQSLQAARTPESDTITPFLAFSFFEDIPESVASVTIENGSIEVTQADGSVATATWDPETGASDFSCAVAANSDGEGSNGEGSTGDERELNALPPLDVFEPSEIGFMNEIGAGFIGFSQLEDATSYEVQAVSAAGETISDAVVSCTDGSCLGTFPDLGRSFLHDFWDFRVRALTEDAVTEWAEIEARSPQSLELCGEYGSLRLFDKDLLFTCDVTFAGFVVLEDSSTQVSGYTSWHDITFAGDSKIYGTTVAFPSKITVAESGSLTAAPSDAALPVMLRRVDAYGDASLTGLTGNSMWASQFYAYGQSRFTLTDSTLEVDGHPTGRVYSYEGTQVTVADSVLWTVYARSAAVITNSTIAAATVMPNTVEEAAASNISGNTFTGSASFYGRALPAAFASNSGPLAVLGGSTTWSRAMPSAILGFDTVRLDTTAYYNPDTPITAPGDTFSWPSEKPLEASCANNDLLWEGFVDFSNTTFKNYAPRGANYDFNCDHFFKGGVNLDNTQGRLEGVHLRGGESSIRNAELQAHMTIEDAALTMESTTLNPYKWMASSGRKRSRFQGGSVSTTPSVFSSRLVTIRDSQLNGITLAAPYILERNQVSSFPALITVGKPIGGSVSLAAETEEIAALQVFTGNTLTKDKGTSYEYANMDNVLTLSGAATPATFFNNEADGDVTGIYLGTERLGEGTNFEGFSSLELRGRPRGSDPWLRAGEEFTFPDLLITWGCPAWPKSSQSLYYDFLGTVNFEGTSFDHTYGDRGYRCGWSFENVNFRGATGEIQYVGAANELTMSANSDLSGSFSSPSINVQDSIIRTWYYYGVPGRNGIIGGVTASAILRLGPGAKFLGASATAPSTAALVQVVGTKQNPVVFTSECDPIANPDANCGVPEALTTKPGGHLTIGAVTNNPSFYRGDPLVEVRNTVFAFADQEALRIDVIDDAPEVPDIPYWVKGITSLPPLQQKIADFALGLDIFESFSSAFGAGQRKILVQDVDFIANDFTLAFPAKWHGRYCSYESYLTVDNYYAGPVRNTYTDWNKFSGYLNEFAFEAGTRRLSKFMPKWSVADDFLLTSRRGATKLEREAIRKVNGKISKATTITWDTQNLNSAGVSPGEVMDWMINTYEPSSLGPIPRGNSQISGVEKCDFGDPVLPSLPMAGLPWMRTLKLNDEKWTPNTTYTQSLLPLVEPYFPAQSTGDWIDLNVPEGRIHIQLPGFDDFLSGTSAEREAARTRPPGAPLISSRHTARATSLGVSWNPAENDNGFTRGYLVALETSPGVWVDLDPECGECLQYAMGGTFTGLEPRTSYRLRVRSVSDYGTISAPSFRIFTTGS